MARPQAPPSPAAYVQRKQQRREDGCDGDRRGGRKERADSHTASERGKEPDERSSPTLKT